MGLFAISDGTTTTPRLLPKCSLEDSDRRARILEYAFQSTGLPNKVRFQQQASYCDRCCNACQRNNFTERDTWHDECENDCGKRNCSGLPPKSDRGAHPRFSQVEALAIQGKILRTCSDWVDVYECI